MVLKLEDELRDIEEVNNKEKKILEKRVQIKKAEENDDENSVLKLEDELRDIEDNKDVVLKPEDELGNNEKEAKPEDLIKSLDEQVENTNKEAAEKGLSEIVHNMGEWYKKQPLKTKLMVSIVLIGTASISASVGGAVGGAVATAALTGSMFQRVLGSAATFVSLEGLMKKSAEKKAKKGDMEVNESEKIRHTIIAGTAAVLVGSGAIGEILGNIYGSWFPDDVVMDNVHENIKEVSGTTVEKAPSIEPVDDVLEKIREGSTQNMTKIDQLNYTPVSPEDFELDSTKETVVGMLAKIHEVQKGDNLWKIIESKLGEKELFDGMAEGQKTHLIDSLKDKFASMSPEELKNIGISSGDIDKLSIGDKIDLSKVFENNILTKAVDSAESLSKGAISSIEANDVKIANWVKIHPDESLTSNKVEEILNNTVDTSNNSVESIVQGDNNVVDNSDTVTTETVDKTQATNETITNKSPEASAATEQPVTPEDIEEVKQIDSERFLNEEKVLSQVNTTLSGDINSIYGSKGFLGIGSTNGMDSVEWKNVSAMSINKVYENTDNQKYIHVMKDYIDEVAKDSGIKIDSKENVEHFLRRALSKIIKK